MLMTHITQEEPVQEGCSPDVQKISTLNLFKELTARVVNPVKCVGYNLLDRVISIPSLILNILTKPEPKPEAELEPVPEPVPELVPELVPEPEPVPVPVPVPEPVKIPKSAFCLALEQLSEGLKIKTKDVQVAPGWEDKISIYKAVIKREVDEDSDEPPFILKDEKTPGIFATFSSNKDFISFITSKKTQGMYDIQAYVHPLWVNLSRVGDFVPTKIFKLIPKKTENELDVMFIISNKEYANPNRLVTVEKQEANELKLLSARDDIWAPPSSGFNPQPSNA